MRLIRACIIAFVAACGVVLGLGFVGMMMTPPELRPSAIRRQPRVPVFRPSAPDWEGFDS